MNTENKIRLAVMLARRCDCYPGGIAKAVARLARHAAKLQRLNEQECNVGVTLETMKAKNQSLGKIANALTDIGIHSCTIVDNGDPRGYPVFLGFKGEDPKTYSNDLGQRGFGIG